jgi:hypothetical protein
MSVVLIASFRSGRDLQLALDKTARVSIGEIETHAPAPPEEASTRSGLPLGIFIAGVAGFLGMYLLEVYADTLSYPLNIGGRPNFSWPSLVPIAFEVGVLCAITAGFFGYLLINRLPRPYDPIDESNSIREASRSRWLMVVRATDDVNLQRARDLLRTLPVADFEELLQ